MGVAVERFDHIVLHCRDAMGMALWYQRVLGMEYEEFEAGHTRRIALKFGNQKINLRPVDADPKSWLTSAVTPPGSADLCLITAIAPEEVQQRLRACDVGVELGPVLRTGALGPMISLYCRDPEGNLIEIASYQTA
jgi:catechol 2,3-dioxygenase-like lactoylglutathione lyase family enzyme